MATLSDRREETRGRRPRALRAMAVLLLTLALALAVAGAGRLARQRAAADLADRAGGALPLAAAALTGVIDTQRLIPVILARDPEVIALLAAPDAAAEARLDAKLADIAAEAGSSVIYLVDADGLAIAASNAGLPDSFVGSDYAFRSYFRDAMAAGTAQQYALGSVSRRPGLYLSRRVDAARGPLGVIVVKVELDTLEARWRDSGYVVFVTDPAGVVLATSEPGWRFGALAPLADPAAARAALQLDPATPFPPVPVAPAGAGLARIERGGLPGLYAGAAAPLGAAAPGWTISLYAPAGATLAAAARAAHVTVLLAGLLLAAAGYWLARRRRWAAARQAALRAMNAELERRVAERTEALGLSNAALAAEMAEREAAETRARRLRDELAQANRLSILGQVAAGVAHEINQPVAAIRAYAETGAQLLDAGDAAEARENLGAIARVTDRIGAITSTLRGFSRRAVGEIGPVPAEAAIDGALALLAGRIRDAGAAIDRGPRADGVEVVAGRIRLEQILVNLLQNALDAVRGQPDPAIRIRLAPGPERVTITVEDSGPGVPEDVRAQLFLPFTTTKETGLGLGLVISADLAREFGGELRLEPAAPGRGAAFTLELPRAP
ncbi:ATP-binding protein [Amaricoccus sp.]|uniref:sensor histidine kinase n=1 Tax=Amaricoccus sp. TaxID=1872485 RepID=UPI001B4C1969|nr:ATP-binding protein [Amaricoccus sp.]MBP7000172.1 sensor histidine kinase [Amaricoccus sp.]